MHCLTSFRKALQDASDGVEIGKDNHDNSHWPHCFDYLRNAILCSADDTLEYPPIVDGKRLPFVDGAEENRKCRNAQKLYDLRNQWGIGRFRVAENVEIQGT